MIALVMALLTLINFVAHINAGTTLTVFGETWNDLNAQTKWKVITTVEKQS